MEAGTFRSGDEDVEVPLQALTEEEALSEAQGKWKKIEDESQACWEEQKRTWAHPPKSPTTYGPREPRLIYKVLLS